MLMFEFFILSFFFLPDLIMTLSFGACSLYIHSFRYKLLHVRFNAGLFISKTNLEFHKTFLTSRICIQQNQLSSTIA